MPLGTGRVPVSLNNLRNHLVRLQKPQVKLQSIMEREGNPDPEVMGVGNIDVIIRRVLVQAGMVAKFSIPMGPRFMALSSMIVFIFDVSRDD